MSTWTNFIENPSATRVYLVQLEVAYDNGSSIDTRTLYMGSHPKEFTHYYHPCVDGTPRFSRVIQELVFGKSMPSWGNLVLHREDGYALSPDGVVTCDKLISGEWECAGRSVEILFGGDDLALTDYQTIMSGVVDRIISWDDTTITVAILDTQEQLRKKEVALNTINATTDIEGITSVAVPVFTWKHHNLFVGKSVWIQSITQADWSAMNDTAFDVATMPDANTFTLTGAPDASGFAAYVPGTDPGEYVRDYYADSPDSIDGKKKPFLIGDRKNIRPLLINKTARKYLVHDIEIATYQGVSTVYAKGVSVAFTEQLADGTFTLDAAQDGTITCDAQGFKYGGSYVEHIGDVVKGLLITCGGLTSGDIIADDITTINTTFPYDLGAYITGKDKVLDVLDKLTSGMPIWCGFTREGKFEIKEFTVPTGTAALELDTRTIHQLKGKSSGDVIYKIILKYDENLSKMSANSIGAVTDDHKAWLEEQWREEIVEDADILDLYPLAEEKEFESALQDRADASVVATKWLNLLKTRRTEIKFLVKSPALACHLGDVISITYDRFGLESGVLHRVIKVEESYTNNEYVITGWR